MFKCEECNKEFKTRQAFAGHMSSHNRGVNYASKRETPRSKLKKQKKHQPKKCKFCNKVFENGWKLGGHVTRCTFNPKREETIKKVKDKLKGKTLSESHTKNISDSMKLAHKEKRAWNIGKSRWNNKQSYPEKFFTKVIENEFNDKEYITEFPIDIYSIDFAWVNKKLAIEIDGEQHYRFDEYKSRDKKKDKTLKENGWKVLRIRWKDLFENPEKFIKIANEFIGK